jgi:hypothetical protein
MLPTLDNPGKGSRSDFFRALKSTGGDLVEYPKNLRISLEMDNTLHIIQRTVTKDRLWNDIEHLPRIWKAAASPEPAQNSCTSLDE